MRLERQFRVGQPREKVLQVVVEDDTLTGLFPDTDTRVVERSGDRKTTVSRYRALGREGEATFHFTFLVDGNLRFEKVCDGNVWRSLRGTMTFEERGKGTSICIELEGKTMETATDELFDLILEVASGKVKTKAEASEYRQIGLWRDGVTN